jgi:hypothetical protein
MFSLRTHALITGGLFALIVAMAIVGNALQASGIVTHPEALQTPMRIVFFSIFIVFAFSLVPTLVKLFVAGQGGIGNADKGFIQLIARHQVGVIVAIWGIWILGIAVALPTMIGGGFFTDLGSGTSPTTSGADNSDAKIAREIAATPVQGTLVVAPGMTVAEMRSGSSLKIDQAAGLPVYAGGAIFNFRIAGTVVEFSRCRHYYITTVTKDPSRIDSINIGTAQAKMTRAELGAANAEVRARLKADGWETGHEVYRDAEDQQLHGGASRGPEGKLWLKGDTVLYIEGRRIDDPEPGEDSATAGAWIQYVDLSTRENNPNIDRYVFAPPEK